MLITSLDNDKIKKYIKLKEKKYRDLYNEFLVEGEHADIRMAMNLYVHNSEEEKFKGIKSLKNFSD